MTSNRPAVAKKPVYIIDGARTPFLKNRGIPGNFSASQLAVSTGSALLLRQNFAANKLDEVILGCVSPSADEANIARVVALRLGCGDKVPAWTVQRNCASGLQAIESAVTHIQTGRSELVLAGGSEAMSHIPLLYNKEMTCWLGKLASCKSFPAKLKHMLAFRPSFLRPDIAVVKGLTDPIVNLSMGQTAEELATLFKINRTAMDEFAALSHQRANKGQVNGAFEEITPLYGYNGEVYEQDDGIRPDSSVEKLAKLRPVFDKFGNVTAGNSSQITDGAAFILLASEEAIERYHLPVLAKVVDIEWAAVNPRFMGLGPIHAMTPILQRNHLSLTDLDHLEINEAFAAQVVACQKAWEDNEYCQQNLNINTALGKIDSEKLNPHGGAIALGHPVGASGARLTLHCAKMLAKHAHRFAMASLCIGGGQGGAILLERV